MTFQHRIVVTQIAIAKTTDFWTLGRSKLANARAFLNILVALSLPDLLCLCATLI